MSLTITSDLAGSLAGLSEDLRAVQSNCVESYDERNVRHFSLAPEHARCFPSNIADSFRNAFLRSR